MPNLPALARIAVAGEPRTARNRRATLAAALRRIAKAYAGEYWTVIPLDHVTALAAELDQPAKSGGGDRE